MFFRLWSGVHTKARFIVCVDDDRIIGKAGHGLLELFFESLPVFIILEEKRAYKLPSGGKMPNRWIPWEVDVEFRYRLHGECSLDETKKPKPGRSDLGMDFHADKYEKLFLQLSGSYPVKLHLSVCSVLQR